MTRRHIRPKQASARVVVHAIYGPNQREHPGKHLVRPWTCFSTKKPVSGVATIHEDLDSARASIPDGLVRIPRTPNDDISLIEVWA